MRILGIDPGLAIVGLGVVEAENPHEIVASEWCTIRTAPTLTFSQRLAEIEKDLNAYLCEMQPDIAVIEKLFFSTNKKTALDVAHARGVIVLCVEKAGIRIFEPTPMQLKNGITGDGHADKEQIQSMLCTLLSLAEIPQPDDAADALALALFGALSTDCVFV
jgi:crossover junction endodeoxyribonuclease RuvC